MRTTAHKRCKTCNWWAGKAEWLARQLGQTSHMAPSHPEVIPGEHWGSYTAEDGAS